MGSLNLPATADERWDYRPDPEPVYHCAYCDDVPVSHRGELCAACAIETGDEPAHEDWGQP